jgi:VWFA-related protein
MAWLVQLALLCSLTSVHAQDTDYTFKAKTEIVLVNVSVRDKTGKLVRDLKPEDFTVKEDGKPQTVNSFDIENTDVVPTMEIPQASVLNAPTAQPSVAAATTGAPPFKDRRLIILFFDLSSMQPEEIDRSVTAARNYIAKQMAPADLVSVLSLGSSLTVNQDFTSNRDDLNKALNEFGEGEGTGYELGSTGTTEGTADTGQSFTVDDTEYNIFNTDRRLEAIRSIAEKLSKVDQKKSLIYFSSGMPRTGIENQSELRATTNAAVRANLSIYTLDISGLQAIVPGGEAQNASLRGSSPYSGKSTLNAYDTNFSSQETLVTLAGDTGGRAFLDSNDFGKVFTAVQEATSMYYLLGYHSTNTERDGKFRRITVTVNRPGVKIDFRRGYYAPADFKHSTREDRERQLEEELASELPSTDLPVYLSAAYFRVKDRKFYVPISVVVPGSEIPFTHSGDKDKATLDVIGVVQDAAKRSVADLRDNVKLAFTSANQVQHRNVQYDTGFELAPGKYHVKLVVRENETGRMGSFETDLTIPDLKNNRLKMSSIVLASQLEPRKSRNRENPLVRGDSEIIPSVTHVFKQGQNLMFFYQVYDPAKITVPLPEPAKEAMGGTPIRVLSNVAFYQAKRKVYETKVVESHDFVKGQNAADFQLEVPLSQLKPGFYTCQVNVIDDVAGSFVFPRVALLVRP